MAVEAEGSTHHLISRDACKLAFNAEVPKLTTHGPNDELFCIFNLNNLYIFKNQKI